MSVAVDTDGTILLQGDCSHEDVEPLLQLLLSTPGATVDWQQCSAAHSAVLQLLLAAKPALRGRPRGEPARWISPVLAHLVK